MCPPLPLLNKPNGGVRRPRLGGIRNLPPPAGAVATAFRSPSLFYYSKHSLTLRPAGAWRNCAATRGSSASRSVPGGAPAGGALSPSPPLSGQSGVPPCGRGLFLRLTLQGLFSGLGATLPRSVGWGRSSLWSCRPQAGLRTTLPPFALSPALRPLRPPVGRPRPLFSPYRSRVHMR